MPRACARAMPAPPALCNVSVPIIKARDAQDKTINQSLVGVLAGKAMPLVFTISNTLATEIAAPIGPFVALISENRVK